MSLASIERRVVEVLCDHGPRSSPRWTVGSGILIGGSYVLTAAHTVRDGEITVRTVGKDEHAASVRLSGVDHDIDLALLEVAGGFQGEEYAQFARVARNLRKGVLIPDCWGVGFPRFQTVPNSHGHEVRSTAQVNGEIPIGDDLGSGMLTLLVNRTPRPLPPAEEDLGSSEWSGMSGTAVFAGERIVGVITEHSPRRGEQSLTVTPITFVDRLPDRASWWQLLDTAPHALSSVPDEPDIGSYLRTLVTELDHDPWTQFASKDGQSISLRDISRPLGIQAEGGMAGQVDVTGDWERLVVLGGPGAGKSWFARRMAILSAQSALMLIGEGAEPQEVELPLFVPFADLAGDGPVWSAVVDASLTRISHLMSRSALALLRQHLLDRPENYLLVFDGLDESGPGTSNRFLEKVLAAAGKGARILLTSRPGAWRNQLPLDKNNARHCLAHLSPLNYPDDVVAVAEMWLANRPEARRRLLEALENRAELAEAARTPLMCAMFCLLTESPDGIPARRSELYRRLVTRLLRGEWRADDQVVDLEPARSALRYLALAGAVNDRETGLADWPDAIAAPLPDPLTSEALDAISHVAPNEPYDSDIDPQPRRFLHRSIREYLLAEQLARLGVVEAATQAEPHLWFDVSWEPILPVAISRHPQRDELLRRMLAGPGPRIDDSDPSLRDGFGELRRLLVRLATETSPGDWDAENRQLIDSACAFFRQAGGMSVDWFVIADAGWPGAQPGSGELQRLLAGGLPWHGSSITPWVRRLSLRAAQRKTLIRLLAEWLSTGKSPTQSHWSGQDVDVALTLLALDPGQAELNTARKGLTGRLRERLSADVAHALRLLGGGLEEPELLDLLNAGPKRAIPDYLRSWALRDLAGAVNELDATSTVRDAAAQLLLNEASGKDAEVIDRLTGALEKLRPGAVALARTLDLLVNQAVNRDSYDRRWIAARIQHLAKEGHQPELALRELVGAWGPWPAWQEAGVALRELARRSSIDARAVAVATVQRRIVESASDAASRWSTHLRDLSPGEEERRTAADALIAKLLDGSMDRDALLNSLKEIGTTVDQKRLIFDYLSTSIPTMLWPSSKLELCLQAANFLPHDAAAGDLITTAIDVSKSPDAFLYPLRALAQRLAFSEDQQSRAVEALIGRLPQSSNLWDVIETIQLIAPAISVDDLSRVVGIIAQMASKSKPSLGVALEALKLIGGLTDERVGQSVANRLLREPVKQWDTRGFVAELLAQVPLVEADRHRLIKALLSHLSVCSPMYYAELVTFADALVPNPKEEAQITEILVTAVKADATETFDFQIAPMLVRRPLTRAQRQTVLACCENLLTSNLSDCWWVLPAAAELEPDSSERSGVVLAVVKGLQDSDSVPTSLATHLFRLGLSAKDKDLLAAALASSHRSAAERDTVVSYDPQWPREEIFEDLVALGLDGVSALNWCLPRDVDGMEVGYERPLRDLARRVRETISYREWSEALLTWSSIDRALYGARVA